MSNGPRDPDRLTKMRQMTNSGSSMRDMEKHFGVSRQHIYQYLRRHKNVIVENEKAHANNISDVEG